VETLAVKSPSDLAAARALVERHAAPDQGPGPSWRLAVAPVAGTIRLEGLEPGGSVEPGATVGTVVSHRSESQVAAVHGGVLVEWLVHDGDPVTPGQAVAVLHPQPALA
jgi:[acyl-carrier-protein] S-malonyltransferase